MMHTMSMAGGALFYNAEASQGSQDLPAGMTTDVYIRRQSRCALLCGRDY